MQKNITVFLSVLLLISCGRYRNQKGEFQREKLFNQNWEFVKDLTTEDINELSSLSSSFKWEKVSLPHTAHIEPLVIKDQQWQGNCFYRKVFKLPETHRGKHIALKFEGAMQVAEVFLNGEKITTHYGGYLPFYVVVSDKIKYDRENILVVKLNNENNPRVPPGKPIDNLDFNWFSGLYRNVWLIVKDPVHISDPIGADRVAAGGIFVRYQDITKEQATLLVQADVNNETTQSVSTRIEVQLFDEDGNKVAEQISKIQKTEPETNTIFQVPIKVKKPRLWSPDFPNLYELRVTLYQGNKALDREVEKIGIRTFRWEAGQFYLNGEPLYLRGTNRHQEYPYIGYALSDNANYRDAYKIKQGGFNFVRLSHYPQSKSFMRACDELGLLTMNAIPGWQFFGDKMFQDNAIQDVRNMVRRDRNHPSVVVWEASLNESGMSREFMQQAHNAVHEEYPGDDVYTCGWIDDVYDVFIPARQHSKPPYYWNRYKKDKPLFIAEYGDWEYYAQNAGFNQKAFRDLTSEERNSRQLRGYGQKRLAQQALNYQEAHNSNLQGPACGDANWLMYDYNRGYAPDIEASGIMDIFRLPKFAYFFYKSQADIKPDVSDVFYKPFIEIANYYNDPSFSEVKVYSNCEEVELLVNGRSLGKQKPDSNRISTHLNHPPFTFHLKAFEPGELTAKGYVEDRMVASAVQRTPGEAANLKVWIDESGKPLQKEVNDVVFLYAAVTDKDGTIVPDATQSVTFKVDGDAELIGNNPVNAEAGIASILLRAGDLGGHLAISASSKGLKTGQLEVIVSP
ncbi:glycoside hydrolase family 2 protein [Thermophagus sp. OGC60D27]|uniref:glycoside hydrolase family 2 protein n=1 Tax=Thermophagus sp. OGC60D27 TaxID=3458415 RepID=UPI004037E51C